MEIEYKHLIQERLQLAYKIVKSNQKDYKTKYKKYYDEKTRQPTIKVGDKMMLHVPINKKG